MLAGGCSGQGFFFPASCLGGVGSAGRLRSRFCQFGDSWRELQGGEACVLAADRDSRGEQCSFKFDLKSGRSTR